jgi:lipid-A-disaccharide synthase
VNRPGRGLLIVAGEPSGDRMAALVARELANCPMWGIAGPACRRAGVRTLQDISRLSAMGVGDVAARAPDLAACAFRLISAVMKAPPASALLVNFTELNAWLGRWLKRRGVRVLWCVAPQAWAWRPGRFRSWHRSLDRLAVILPFEEPLWRAFGVDAHYVGHPSLDVPAPPRALLRAELGIAPDALAAAVLPGSRPGEIARLAPILCEAAARLGAGAHAVQARLLLAPWLDARARLCAEQSARRHGIAVVEADRDHGSATLIGAFDIALAASGTACLEAALAGVPPVIAYRTDAVSYALGRLLIRTPHIALPNILLGRRAFPELLQAGATAAGVEQQACRILDDPERGAARRIQAELRARLAPADKRPFGVQVAELLRPWLIHPT